MKRSRFRDFFWRHSFSVAFLVMAMFVAFVIFAGYTYSRITTKFDSSRRWDLPSRIYSDATPLLPGLSYPRSLLEPKLNHVGYYEVKHAVSKPGEYRFRGDDLEIYLQSFDYPDIEFRGMPVLVQIEGGIIRRLTRLTDNVSLRGVRVEPELITSVYDEVMEDRLPVALSSVPQYLIDAVIVTEDRGFYRHEGISVRGILRAALTNYRGGTTRAGGSTITQQLVKNLYLNPERTMTRKLHEALMAVLLDARYEKKQILEAYLNEIYLGQNGSVQIVGVEQAAQMYFSKRARNLTLPEAATLAGMIRSPNVLSPIRAPDRATARRNLVLVQMRDHEKISEAEYQRAVGTPMTVNKYPKQINSAPFFVDLVLKELRETYPQTQLQTEGLRIFTTLDTMMQRSAEQALTSGAASLSKRYSHIRKSKTPLEGVVITIQPGTGYVKALVGGRSYRKSQFNRAFQARRQPGSLFKPFVYLAAMDPVRGENTLTASTILDDSPIAVRTGSTTWRPQNYDGKFRGPTTARRALAYSYNIPAVRAALRAGVPNVIDLASSVGVNSKLQPYPSVSLGSFEVTPLELAYAYSVFANGGVKAEPVSILAVATRDGRVLETREVKMKRVAPANLCYVMNHMLRDVLEYGTAAKTRSLGFRHPYAGKTGTTNSYRDAWFVGYSPRVLTLVWVGFDNGQSTRLAGSDAAVPIWTAHMNRVARMVPDAGFRRPDDVVERQVDESTGMLAASGCPKVRTEIFVTGTEPRQVCSVHSASESFWPFSRSGESQGDEPGITDGSSASPESSPNENAEPRRRKKEKGLRKVFGWIFD